MKPVLPRVPSHFVRGKEMLAVLSWASLFRDLPREALEKMAESARFETYRAGALAIELALTPERFYLIVSGRLLVYHVHPDTAREIGLMLLGAGDVFDPSWILGDPERGVSTRAVESVEVASVPVHRVQACKATYPAFDRAIRDCVAQQLRSLSDLAIEVALYPTEVRLARLILRQAKIRHPGQVRYSTERLPQSLVASLIGCTRECVSRHMHELKRKGVISTDRSRITVEDLASLGLRARSLAPPLIGSNRSPEVLC